METKITGKIIVVGDNIDTDQIYPGRFLALTDPKEIAELRGIFKFKDRGSNSECMCCGHPGIDWWKGDELLARTAVQHLTALRWKRFNGDAELTPEASEALSAWFAARSIKAAK